VNIKNVSNIKIHILKKSFIDKIALGSRIQFIDISTRRNIEQTPADLHAKIYFF
jgi:hypothetical protein